MNRWQRSQFILQAAKLRHGGARRRCSQEACRTTRMRQSERDMGKFAQAVNRLVECVEDVGGGRGWRGVQATAFHHRHWGSGQGKARFAVDMSSKLNPSMELDALNHNWLKAYKTTRHHLGRRGHSTRSPRLPRSDTFWSQRRLLGADGAYALRACGHSQ